MLKGLFFLSVFISARCVYAQQSDCQVTVAEISLSYSGQCKNGLAHGKGIAQGVDHYEGQFIKGKPEGKGLYKWSDGTYYDGQWKNGMQEGKGKMVYRDSVVTGFWKANKYQGEEQKPAYKITRIRNVGRSTILKSIESGNGVKIKILLGGTDNTEIEDFSLAYTSGTEYRNIGTYGIQNSSVPLDVTVRYLTWNQLHTAQYEVLFEFTVYDPGTWNVAIANF